MVLNTIWLIHLLLLPLVISFRSNSNLPLLQYTPSSFARFLLKNPSSSASSSFISNRFKTTTLFDKKLRLPEWITPEERTLRRTFLQEKKDIPFALVFRGANTDIQEFKKYLKSIFEDDFLDVQQQQYEYQSEEEKQNYIPLEPTLYNIHKNNNDSLTSTKTLFQYHAMNNHRDYCLFSTVEDQKVFLVFNHLFHDTRSLGTLFQGTFKSSFYNKAKIPKYFTKRMDNSSTNYQWNEGNNTMRRYPEYYTDGAISVFHIDNSMSTDDYIFWKVVAFISQSLRSTYSAFRIFTVPSTRKILQRQLTLATGDHSCLTIPLQLSIPYPRNMALRTRVDDYCKSIRKNQNVFRFQQEYDQYYQEKSVDNVKYGPVFQYHSYLDSNLCYLEKFELLFDVEPLIPYWGHFLKDTVMVTEDEDGFHRILYTNLLPPTPKINPRNLHRKQRG